MSADLRASGLYIESLGQGSAVVLLHGFLESSTMWLDLKDRLSSSYLVICIDLPGHGRSPILTKEPSIDLMAQLVHAALQSHKIERASIIGHSMGAYVGLAINDLFPNFVDKLIMLHSKAANDSIETKIKRDKGIEMLQKHPLLYIKESITNLFWTNSMLPFEKEITKLINEAKSGNYQGYIQALIAMKNRADRTNQLREKENIFYIAGKHDPVIPFKISVDEMANMKDSHGSILESAGHMGFIEEKKTCEKMIVAFLNSSD